MNEIEFATAGVDWRDREAANAGDAASVATRSTAAANDADGVAFARNAGSALDNRTSERLRRIRDADRKRVEELLSRNVDVTSGEAATPPVGTGQPAGSEEGGVPGAANLDSSTRAKPIFDRTGYDLPTSVSNQYVAQDGKFLDRRSETVHFEDTGRRLATASEDREVISHMVEIAKAKHWGEIQLKGTEEFRRQAWIAAELAGVASRGFNPDTQDRAMLTAAREAMRISAGQRSADGTVDQPTQTPTQTNTIESTSGQQRDLAGPDRTSPSVDAKADRPDAGSNRARTGRRASTRASRRGREQASATVPLEQPPAGVTAGVLVAHGAAPFNHDEKQNPSYYATVQTATGDRTVWGLDLERAIGESGVQPGQRIELEKGGSRTVTAGQRQFDAAGNELDPKTVTSRRNEWLVSSSDVAGLPSRAERQQLEAARRDADERQRISEARDRFLSGEWKYSEAQQATLDAARERIKEQAAREVLRDEIRNLPAQQQEQLLGEFESAVAAARAANRPLDVPMPQVSEATIDAVRREIERESATHGSAAGGGGQKGAREADARTVEQQEAGHDTPTFELEP